MKDKDGFTIRCKYTQWEIYDSRDNKDFMCEGNYPKVHCYGDESCAYYVPDIKEESQK